MLSFTRVQACGRRSSGRHDVSRRWAAAAQMLHLTHEQAERVLTVRTEHLCRLERIYEERRSVNLEAISVLVRPKFSNSIPWL